MNLQEFFKKTLVIKTYADKYEFQEVRPRIFCKDGINLSVQAGKCLYCSPRINGDWNYREVEVGYPSIRPPETWEEYYEGTWQHVGFLGSIKRVWRDRDSFVWNVKEFLKGNKLSRIMLKYILSFRDNATTGIYAYIPTILVEKFIDDHGGIDEEKTFKDK